MKFRYQATGLALTAALAVTSLNSCYFNSAGKIFEAASHKAAVVTTDLSVGGFVYTDGNSYYIELPRYKTGKPVKLHYSIAEQDQPSSSGLRRVAGETCMVRIPYEYAMYLTGQADGPSTPSTFTVINDGHDLKYYCRALPVKKNPDKMVCHYTHTSPHAPWLYTLGVFDWLCVDLPVTCVENAAVMSLFFLVVMAEANKKPQPTTTTTTTVVQETTTYY